MDPLTHGLLGATVTQAFPETTRRLGRSRVAVLGAAAAMAPDLDVVIRSAVDPLTQIAYHRHFTHALAFTPIGAFLILLLWLCIFPKAWPHWKRAYGISFLAYLTHPLLDACTSYGTQLFWPFSDTRTAWDIVAVIDPAVTLALATGAILAWHRYSSRLARIGLALALLYLALGAFAHHRALAAQARLAATRGDERTRGRVVPTLGNLFIWDSVYQSGSAFQLDRIALPPLQAPRYIPGPRYPALTQSDVARLSAGDPHILSAVSRFVWFCDGYATLSRRSPATLSDLRYVLDGVIPLWGITLYPHHKRPVIWVQASVDRQAYFLKVWRELNHVWTQAKVFGQAIPD